MFKYIGISVLQSPLDMKRYTAIQKVSGHLQRSDLVVLDTALRATHLRLSQSPREETERRLTQRLRDLPMIRAYFESNRDVVFLGMYGWGDGCQVSAASGEGISEYDAIVYLKNGKRYVEKIGSCWQLFQKQDRLSRLVSSGTITSGGDVFLMNTAVAEPSELFLGEARKTPAGFAMPSGVSISENSSVESSAVRPSSLDRSDAGVGNPILGTMSLHKNPEPQGVAQQKVPVKCTKRKDIPAGLTFMNRPSCTDQGCTDKKCNPDVHETTRVRSTAPFLESLLDTHPLGVPVDISKKMVTTESVRPKRRLKPHSVPPVGLNAYCMTADEFLKQAVSKSVGCQDANCKDSSCVPLLVSRAVPEAKDPLSVDTQEGCPCCLNAIDLDELAGLGKVLSNTESTTEFPSFEMESIDANWGIVAGVAGPFALIGLVAAYRNVVGAYETRQKLLAKKKEVEALIAESSTPQRLAYLYCLQYSLFDANWNIGVPGALNGGSSSAVLSTLIVSSPLAIPALGAYAAAQAGRGIYDTVRFWNEMTGHDKLDQITVSKRRFYLSNTTAFTCMAMGAALVAASPATFGSTLIPGLCLLIPGTVSSGVLNNIWPRKFRPRNGSLSVSRETLDSQTCLRLIDKLKEEKTIIKAFKKRYLKSSLWLKTRRVSAKLLGVLPFCEARAGRWLHGLSQEQLAVSRSSLTMHQDALFQELNMNSGDQTVDVLLTTYLKSLRYRQYGLVDFYWGLRRFES